MGLRWVVTRTEADSQPVVAELRAAGFDAVAVPCLERADAPWPEWPPPTHGERLLVFVTSQSAAGLLTQVHTPPAHALFAAVSPTTREHLESHGLVVTVASPQGALGLASAVAEWRRLDPSGTLRIWYPTSDLGLDAKEQSAALVTLERLGTVERFTAYRVSAPQGLAEALAAQGEGRGVVFFSPSSVAHYFEAAPPKPRAVVCHGESTRRAWNERRPPTWPEPVLRPASVALADVLSPLERSLR